MYYNIMNGSLHMTRLIALMSICLAAGGAPPERIRVLFLTGQTDLPYHDWRISTPFYFCAVLQAVALVLAATHFRRERSRQSHQPTAA